jgi:hypothetical protein
MAGGPDERERLRGLTDGGLEVIVGASAEFERHRQIRPWSGGNEVRLREKQPIAGKKVVELGGFEPPTSWVRYKATLSVPPSAFRILERCNSRFLSKTYGGCTSIYAGICGDSGTHRC